LGLSFSGVARSRRHAVAANLAFRFKMAMFALGLINAAAFRRRFRGRLATDGPLPGAAAFAPLSMASWISVLLAGRVIAYV
jgi:hypothetical protein